MRKRILILIVGIGISLLFLSVLIYWLRRDTYQVQTARRGEIVEAIYGLGKVKNLKAFELKVSISSTVKKLYVQEGDRVKIGDPLVDFQELTLFRSPISGIVTLVHLHQAELVSPQQPLLRVEDLSDRYIEVSLEQQGILRVQPGQKARILFESLRAESYDGSVTSLFSRNDEFLARIDIQKLPENILPGMTADVAIEVARRNDALLVPLSSVNHGRITLVKNGKRKKVQVKIGAIDGAWAEILDGEVKEGDSILVGLRGVERN